MKSCPSTSPTHPGQRKTYSKFGYVIVKKMDYIGISQEAYNFQEFPIQRPCQDILVVTTSARSECFTHVTNSDQHFDHSATRSDCFLKMRVIFVWRRFMSHSVSTAVAISKSRESLRTRFCELLTTQSSVGVWVFIVASGRPCSLAFSSKLKNG